MTKGSGGRRKGEGEEKRRKTQETQPKNNKNPRTQQKRTEKPKEERREEEGGPRTNKKPKKLDKLRNKKEKLQKECCKGQKKGLQVRVSGGKPQAHDLRANSISAMRWNSTPRREMWGRKCREYHITLIGWPGSRVARPASEPPAELAKHKGNLEKEGRQQKKKRRKKLLNKQGTGRHKTKQR